MDKMKELYDKVSKDSALLAKFNAIISDAEKAGDAATEEKLTAFAKEAGFDVKLEDMRDFFKKLAETKEGELSDVELDMVAGGKGLSSILNIVASAGSLGLACAIGSAKQEAAHAITSSAKSCGDCFR